MPTLAQREKDARFQELKDTIEKIYLENDGTLASLMQEMFEKHGLPVSKSQYERHLKAWGFKKYGKAGDYPKLRRLTTEQEHQRNLSYTIHKRRKTKRQMQKEFSRYRKLEPSDNDAPEGWSIEVSSPGPHNHHYLGIQKVIINDESDRIRPDLSSDLTQEEFYNWIFSVIPPIDPESPIPASLITHIKTLPWVIYSEELEFRLSCVNPAYDLVQGSVFSYDVQDSWLHTELCSEHLFRLAPSYLQSQIIIVRSAHDRSHTRAPSLEHVFKTHAPKSAMAILEFINLIVYYATNCFSYKGLESVKWLAQTISDYQLLEPLRLLLDGYENTYIKELSRFLLIESLENSYVQLAKLVLLFSAKLEDCLPWPPPMRYGRIYAFNATPLFIAVWRDDTRMVRALVDMGANVNVEVNMEQKAEKFLGRLRDPSRVRLEDPERMFSYDAPYNRTCLCGQILPRLWTPLKAAADSGNFEICSMLLSKKAKVEPEISIKHPCMHNHVTETAMQEATKFNFYADAGDSFSDERQNRLKIVQLLIQEGANTNYPYTCASLTPIQNAFIASDQNLIDCLVDNGASLTQGIYPKSVNSTLVPLFIAVAIRSRGENLTILSQLLNNIGDNKTRLALLQLLIAISVFIENDVELLEFTLKVSDNTILTQPIDCLLQPPQKSPAPSVFVFFLELAVRYCKYEMLRTLWKNLDDVLNFSGNEILIGSDKGNISDPNNNTHKYHAMAPNILTKL